MKNCNELLIPGFAFRLTHRLPILESVVLEQEKHVENVSIYYYF